jgi:ubiquinone/menaquinone biosynthesis C-methylase UbiE
VAAADAAALPFAGESLDYVNLAHTLEHTPDPVAALAECRRVLRPQGVVQIVVPNSASWGSRRYGSRWRALDVPRHLCHFTAASLRAVAQRAGLRVLAASTLDDAWVLQESAKLAGETEPPALGALSRWLLRRRGYGESLSMWCART